MGIAKRGHFGSRHRQFVQRELLIKIMRKAVKLRDQAAAMFFLASYVFLLRAPSEGLPMRKGGGDEDAQLYQSVIAFDKDEDEVCSVVCMWHRVVAFVAGGAAFSKTQEHAAGVGNSKVVLVSAVQVLVPCACPVELLRRVACRGGPVCELIRRCRQ